MLISVSRSLVERKIYAFVLLLVQHVNLSNLTFHSPHPFTQEPTALPQTAPSTWVAQGAVGFTPPEQHVQFCDTFGAERSRTWAPTEEAGDFYLRLTQSCLRVVALAAASGATTCDVADELCCDRKVPQFTRVFSLQSFNTSKPDYFVTNNAEEAKVSA